MLPNLFNNKWYDVGSFRVCCSLLPTLLFTFFLCSITLQSAKKNKTAQRNGKQNEKCIVLTRTDCVWGSEDVFNRDKKCKKVQCMNCRVIWEKKMAKPQEVRTTRTTHGSAESFKMRLNRQLCSRYRKYDHTYFHHFTARYRDENIPVKCPCRGRFVWVP